ncbi:MAG: TIGR00341 family protein [Alphaproteobacteria bacterium]|nr:MAG: TIGR00341 family protein [Alphaproteobacteria bacterium]
MQSLYAADNLARMVVLPVEASLPRLEAEPSSDQATDMPGKKPRGLLKGISREELYEDVRAGATLDANFLVLVMLSTVVAAIGLVENNIAVVIGAMVIAPLLGPNLALALATVLGDGTLMRQALKTNIAGVGTTVALSAAMGILWPSPLDSPELLSRTSVGFDGVALAIASGAAAALSLASGLAMSLVGVMVAVALMPPAVTFGMFVGAGQPALAAGALMLLAVNVICVNLAADAVFWLRGVAPRTWSERRGARRTMQAFVLVWLIALMAVVLIIAYRPGFLNGMVVPR